MLDKLEIDRRVQRGAVLLDEKMPGWWERVDICNLAISSCYGCVLSKLGSFEETYCKLGLQHRELPDYGFAAFWPMTLEDWNLFPNHEDDPKWAALTAAWKCLIEARRTVSLPASLIARDEKQYAIAK